MTIPRRPDPPEDAPPRADRWTWTWGELVPVLVACAVGWVVGGAIAALVVWIAGWLGKVGLAGWAGR